jgi:hypothetical protein
MKKIESFNQELTYMLKKLNHSVSAHHFITIFVEPKSTISFRALWKNLFTLQPLSKPTGDYLIA